MMISMKRTAAVAVIVASLAAACGGSDDDGAGGDTSTTAFTLLPTTTAPETTTTVATTSTTLPPATTSTAAPTSTSTTVPQPATTAPNPAIAALLLSGEGIGAAGLGADPDGVTSYIGSYLGEPSNDTGWVDPFTIGPCSGSELRLVSWGVLTVLFGDVSNVLQGRRHFFAYTYGVDGEIGAEPVGLETTRGVRIGSRVIDVKAGYPAATLNPEDEFTPPFFYVNDNLSGYLTSIDDDGTVTAILGGENCGL